ncbi:hypothetical protein QFZ77_004436 [Paenibacillus sp. V4I3]|uniref:hypothetical protein n=1 Tax=unclassified Paenibacillus TaxID=185978 RepID=UPI0027803C1B|nr:hypothetical protein [Paenibacillus sp. V4I3]MDQ0888151.1 hypothetical protein [Paenibacillus sp. V4I9]
MPTFNIQKMSVSVVIFVCCNPPEKQPLVLPNNPQAHAVIYFDDPDGNSLEFITPLRLDYDEEFPMMAVEKSKTKRMIHWHPLIFFIKARRLLELCK